MGSGFVWSLRRPIKRHNPTIRASFSHHNGYSANVCVEQELWDKDSLTCELFDQDLNLMACVLNAEGRGRRKTLQKRPLANRLLLQLYYIKCLYKKTWAEMTAFLPATVCDAEDEVHQPLY